MKWERCGRETSVIVPIAPSMWALCIGRNVHSAVKIAPRKDSTNSW